MFNDDVGAQSDELSRGEGEERFEYLAADLSKRQRKIVRNRHVKELVSRIIARRGFSQQQASESLQRAWQEVVGERIAHGSRPGTVRRGTLYVEVNNSIIAQEVEFAKQKIVRSLQSHLPDAGIARLRIRVG